MSKKELLIVLRALFACREARSWVKNVPEEDPARMWDLCSRPDWMVWLAASVPDTWPLIFKIQVDAMRVFLPSWEASWKDNTDPCVDFPLRGFMRGFVDAYEDLAERLARGDRATGPFCDSWEPRLRRLSAGPMRMSAYIEALATCADTISVASAGYGPPVGRPIISVGTNRLVAAVQRAAVQRAASQRDAAAPRFAAETEICDIIRKHISWATMAQKLEAL